jgi:hypothetical protein
MGMRSHSGGGPRPSVPRTPGSFIVYARGEPMSDRADLGGTRSKSNSRSTLATAAGRQRPSEPQGTLVSLGKDVVRRISRDWCVPQYRRAPATRVNAASEGCNVVRDDAGVDR